MFAPTSTLDVYTDYNDQVLGAGQSLKDVINNMASGYMFEQYLGAEWASDWSQPDELHPAGGGGGAPEQSGPAMAGRLPKDARFPHWLRKHYAGSGKQLHHIATPYGAIGRQFTSLFARANMTLGESVNALPMLKHSGPHSASYHQLVYQRLASVMKKPDGTWKAGVEAEEALRRELRAIANGIGSGKIPL